MTMRLKSEDLQTLVSRRGQEDPIITLYMNFSSPEKKDTELNSLLTTIKQQIKRDERFSGQQKEALQGLAQQMYDSVQTRIDLKSGSRMLVLFADTNGLWKEFQLPVTLPSQMHVDFTPFTRPLSGLMDEFKRYGVLITDSRQARIFTLYLGEIETSQDVFIQDEVPDRVRVKASMASGRGQVMSGLGDQRIQRHIEDHVHRHLKNVADQAFTLFKSSGFERLILASTEDQLISKLYDHLHSYLQERCVAQFTADPRDNWDQLRQKALETAQSWEREHEVEIIDHLLEENNSGGKAVLGVEPVLEALIFGQVHTLVLEHNIQLGGSVCDEDRTLSTYLDTCPLCGQPMRQTEDLTEELVEEAVGQNAEVEHVFVTHEDFKPYGIGAFLRFTM